MTVCYEDAISEMPAHPHWLRLPHCPLLGFEISTSDQHGYISKPWRTLALLALFNIPQTQGLPEMVSRLQQHRLTEAT